MKEGCVDCEIISELDDDKTTLFWATLCYLTTVDARPLKTDLI